MDPNLPKFTFDHVIDVKIQSTHTWRNAPPLDVLLVPGGMGNMALLEDGNTWMEDFVKARYPKLKYLLSVCTGSVTLALSGVLKNKQATTNKASWAWVVQHGKNIKWVPSARWTQDGKIWTSSGVAAGKTRSQLGMSFRC
jgi:putative intracellular protease/amidase